MSGGYINIKNEVLMSDAFEALTPNAKLVLLCLIKHYVEDAGWAKDQFRCSVRRMKRFCGLGDIAIDETLEELRAFGFVNLKRGKPGRKPGKNVSKEQEGRSNAFTLTFIGDKATNEWAKISTTRSVVRARSKAKSRTNLRRTSSGKDNSLSSLCKDNIQGDSTFGCDVKPYKTRVAASLPEDNISSDPRSGPVGPKHNQENENINQLKDSAA